MIVVATHYALVGGKRYEAPSSTLIEVLEQERADFVVLRHSLDGSGPSTMHRYAAGVEASVRRLPVPRQPSPLRYIAEVILSVVAVLRMRQRLDAYVGVDPLNAAAGIVLRRLGAVRQAVFFTADYTPTRFDNPWLNRAYHAVDRWCVRRADEVWSVSSRIVDERRRQGLAEERNVFVPNVPAIPDDVVALPEDRQPHTVITLGMLGPQQDYRGLIDAVALLRDEVPDCRLTIVGNGPSMDELASYVDRQGLADAVTLTGHLDHHAALNLIARSGVGAAVYNGEWSFNHYGDSMKCREFMHFGLPIVTTDSHSTVDEIRDSGAGVVCDQSVQAYVEALRTIFENPVRFGKASAALAERHTGVHRRMLRSLQQT